MVGDDWRWSGHGLTAVGGGPVTNSDGPTAVGGGWWWFDGGP